MPHALCVGRHRYLSEHLGAFFGRYGVSTTCVVGLQEAIEAAEECRATMVICDYDLLALVPLVDWERHRTLSRLPLVAVSMTRRADEMHPLDVNGVTGFLYLPTLKADQARRVVGSFAAPYSLPPLDRVAVRAPVSPA
jgi:hypothetical protein